MLVGLYIGMAIVLIVAVCLLFLFDLVQPIKDTKRIDSLYFIIPMFRGIGLFIFYLWGMAINVFIFNNFRVSYRRILYETCCFLYIHLYLYACPLSDWCIV